MSTSTNRAAEVLWSAECSDGLRAIMRPDCMLLAQALADAGLLATPERDAEQRRAGAVEALREVADYLAEDPPIVDVVTWLRERADRIEAPTINEAQR